MGITWKRPLRDQLVCELKDHATQKDLLCTKELSLTLAVEKARAAEAVNREVLHFPLKTEAETLKLYDHVTDVDSLGTQELPVYIRTNVAISVRNGHLSSVCWHN